MRIIMMGTGPFAVPTFERLIQSRHTMVALVTRPPKSGRGKHRPHPSPMQLVAEREHVPIAMPASINTAEAQQQLAEYAADLFVVCDYGQILSAKSLALARLGGINLHGSLLPAYRGAAPVHWAIYDGCHHTGVTVIHMTPRLDAGPSLVQHRVEIGPRETVVALEERLARVGVVAVEEAIGMLTDWDGHSQLGTLQDPRKATRAPRLKREDGEIDWSRTAVQIAHQVRAFWSWPGSYSHLLRAGQPPLRVILDEVRPLPAAAPCPPGTIVEQNGQLVVGTGEGGLEIVFIQPAGKKRQPWDAFLRGYRVEPGWRFGSHG